MQPAALACGGGFEGQSVEVILDSPEAAHPQRTRFIITSHEHTEVQLGQRDDADRRVLICGPFSAAIRTDVSSRTATGQATQGSVSSPPSARRSSSSVGSGGALHRSASWPLGTHCGANRAELGDRAPRDGDRELLTGLCASQNLAHVVAKLLWGIVAIGPW